MSTEENIKESLTGRVVEAGNNDSVDEYYATVIIAVDVKQLQNLKSNIIYQDVVITLK